MDLPQPIDSYRFESEEEEKPWHSVNPFRKAEKDRIYG